MLKLEEIKEFLRIDHDTEDDYLLSLRYLAKEICENYLREPLPTASIISIRQAQLLVVAHFYENRGDSQIPDAVYRLLDSYRKEVF